MKGRLSRVPISTFRDGRGVLRVFEKGASLRFVPRRCYVLSDVPRGRTRGGHKVSCDLFLTALTGACRILFRREGRETAVRLGRSRGVHVPRGTWVCLDRFSPDAIVLVCASRAYKDTRYSEQLDGTNTRARRAAPR